MKVVTYIIFLLCYTYLCVGNDEGQLKDAFINAETASQFFKTRSKRENSWTRVEEFQGGNIERECEEESCSREEAREAFEDDFFTDLYWRVYTDPHHCLSNTCISGNSVRCEDLIGNYFCHCRLGYTGRNCQFKTTTSEKSTPLAPTTQVPAISESSGGCSNPGNVGIGAVFMGDQLDEFPVGYTAAYECRAGYITAGQITTRDCQANFMWTVPQFQCVFLDCRLPEGIRNGDYTLKNSRTTFGSSVTYSCNLGYNITSGDAKHYCTFDGISDAASWTGTLPICQIEARNCDLLDLAFVLDSSESVGPEYFQRSLEFLQSFLEQLNIGFNETRVAVVHFDRVVHPVVNFTQSSSLPAVENTTQTIEYSGDRKWIPRVFAFVGGQIFSRRHGNRHRIPDIAIIFTDGLVGFHRVDRLKNRNIRVIVIPVGDNVDSAKINEIASDPDDENVFDIKNMTEVRRVVEESFINPCP